MCVGHVTHDFARASCRCLAGYRQLPKLIAKFRSLFNLLGQITKELTFEDFYTMNVRFDGG